MVTKKEQVGTRWEWVLEEAPWPAPQPLPTPGPEGTPAPETASFPNRPRVDLPALPGDLLDPFPTITQPFQHENSPAFSLWGLVELGHHFGWTYVSQGDDGTSFSTYHWSKTILGVRLQFSREKLSVKATLPIGEKTVYSTDEGGTLTRRQSVSMEVAWAGWNTTSEVAYNSTDYTIAAGAAEDDRPKVTGYQGIYARDKPFQDLAFALGVEAALAGLALVGFGAASLILTGGKQLLLGSPGTP